MVLVDQSFDQADRQVIGLARIMALVGLPASIELAGDGDGGAVQGEFEPYRSRSGPARHRQAELIDGQAQVFDLLDVEVSPGSHGGRRDPGQHQQLGTNGQRQYDRVAHPCSASSTVEKMGNTRMRSVISNTLRIRGSAMTSLRSPPDSRTRLNDPTRTPSAVESRNETPRRSTTTAPTPASSWAARCSRRAGAVATSISPPTETTGTPPVTCSVISKVSSMVSCPSPFDSPFDSPCDPCPRPVYPPPAASHTSSERRRPAVTGTAHGCIHLAANGHG